MSSIQGIKLVTGEELVAKVTFADADFCTVADPLVLRVGAGPEGFVVNFFPWTIISSGDIKIRNDAIIARFTVPKDVETNYLQNTSGIQIVSGAAVPQILKG